MTLYTYDDWIEKIFNVVYDISEKEEPKRYKICKCLIDWVRKFVRHMLIQVYGYTEQNL